MTLKMPQFHSSISMSYSMKEATVSRLKMNRAIINAFLYIYIFFYTFYYTYTIVKKAVPKLYD